MTKPVMNLESYSLATAAVENISERFARVVADYSSFQAKVKQRLSKLEVDENKSK